MAYYSAALPLLLLLCFCSAFSNAKHFLSVPVFKQPVTGRFVAKIFRGTEQQHDQQAADLVLLDLGGPVTRLDCRHSSTHRPVSCPSLQCSKAGAAVAMGLLGDDQLAEDAVAVGSDVDSVYSSVDRFLFHCSASSGGVLGLGRSRMSLPSQFSMTHFVLDRKFTLCLSPSASRLLIGDALAGTEISKTLIYTPLLTPNEHSHQHLIPVKSIRIGSTEPESVKVNGKARLSTTTPFTTLKSSIYQSFTNKFVKAVTTSNINATVVTESVWPPFKTCFVGGSVFPEVELVLQSEMVKWRISRGNLMVVVDKENGVSCLGILDGGDGSEDEDEIVIGRYQLEENLMEFDMSRSMLGFRSTSCEELKLLDSAGSRRGGQASS